MITKVQRVEYLISTVGNFTGAPLAEHLHGVSHDRVTDYLRRARLPARRLWELVSGPINDSEQAFLIADHSAPALNGG